MVGRVVGMVCDNDLAHHPDGDDTGHHHCPHYSR